MISIYLMVILFVQYAAISCDNDFYKTIQFINSKPTRPDEKRCTGMKVDANRVYITGMEPEANDKVVHHMVLIACAGLPKTLRTLDEDGNSWICDDHGDNQCGPDKNGRDIQKVLFTWALDADGYTFPPDTGYRIGSDSELNYVVLQIHYSTKLTEENSDNSALHIRMTLDDLPFQAATYILGGDGFVPAKVPEFHMETACEFKLNYDITPLAYRTHSHHLGDVISGYLIRDGKWIEIGRMSPRQPEQYYDATNKDLVVGEGDILAARCTMSSFSRSDKTYMGHTNADEMCVFYMLYSTSYRGEIDDSTCFHNANRYSWARDPLITTAPPKDVSSLKNVHLKRIENELDREELERLELRPPKHSH